ncbi:MAG TPA: bifunctional metallophosphatase/5'-nucleotidase [Ferruginibacter sp.]|nr:bifunctional metallophosphatase/5'-nucleotidase [Ferruginibacter sp.]
MGKFNKLPVQSQIMTTYYFRLLLVVSIISLSCSSTRNTGSKDNGKINITFVQVNDVYEIAPLEAGKSGGLARIATIKKEYQQTNPNTFLVMAGDFLSPSVYNSLQYEGKRIRGKQMVEAMNAARFDFAMFGNHEFDITENELQSRLNESGFQWVSSNSFHHQGDLVTPFTRLNAPIPETYIKTVRDADGTVARIGFIALTIPFNKAPYVSYTDPLATAELLYNRLKDSCDAVIAITHQLIKDDIVLAQKLPGLTLIIGGHEHDSRFEKVGSVYITKAHANARSAFIIKVSINKRKGRSKVVPVMKMLDQSVSIDSAADMVVKKWGDIAEKNYASIGFDAKKIILSTGDPLDGRESEIRTKPTNLSRIIISAMEKAAPDAAVAIVNSGSIRVDDILQLPVSQYDIIRALPFGGSIMEADMKGSLLIKILDAGRNNKGIGGFLHYSEKLAFNPLSNTWTFNKAPIDLSAPYRVAVTDFLLTGGEANMGFLKKENPDIIKVYPVVTSLSDPRSDIRLAIIRYLETH